MNINTYLYKNEKLIENILNIEALYDKTNESIYYEEKDIKISLKYSSNYISYERTNNDYIFGISIKENIAYCYIKLINENTTFELEILESNYNLIDNKIELTYRLISEEDIINKLVIEIL